MKILPELLKSVEFGGGGPKVFAVVMKIAAKLTDEDFEAKITPVVVRLFTSPDRAIRVCLLNNLPSMIDRLQQKVVNDKIFPQMVSRLSAYKNCMLSHCVSGNWLHGCSTCSTRTDR
jgi:SCY1-like protein 1